MIMSKRVQRISIMAVAAVAAIGASAFAASLSRVAVIEIPGNKLEQFDIGYVDSEAGRYYVTHRPNAGGGIFDTGKITYVVRATGLRGPTDQSDTAPGTLLRAPHRPPLLATED